MGFKRYFSDMELLPKGREAWWLNREAWWLNRETRWLNREAW
jgi:hypothetical protein